MGRYKSVVDGVLLPLGTGTAAAVIANQLPQNQRSTKKVLEAKDKKLKKVEAKFEKSADFNERAAQEAFDLVMKMDTETARVFTSMIVADVVEETIEKNLRTFQGRLDRVVAKREDQIKKALVRVAMESPEKALPYAKALTEITKAKTPYDYGYRFQESDFNRDPSTGQFRMKVKHTMAKPVSEKQAPAVIGTKNPQGLKGKDLARYQDEYRQVAGFLDSVSHSMGLDNANVVMHLRDRTTGERWVEPVFSKKPPKDIMENPNIEVQAMQARPTTLTVGGAAFGLSTALGGQPSGPYDGHGAAGAARGFDDFATSWMSTDRDDAKNSNARTYRRVEAGSKYLGQIAPAGSKLQMAAAFGQFAGEMGPQAEMVIGPSARKTAYRYRGTEKTPDADLVRAYELAVNRAKQSSVMEARSGPRRLTERPMGSGHTPVTQRAQEIQAQRRSPTWAEREPGRAEIVGYLQKNKLPNEELSELQLASGHTPPSEGVMLNRDGQIVTQAVGYADDHYLPFNLKHLKELKGGEYIRTRSYGGLTSEDVYTGLVSGARRVTVVSHNGVFTMEFEPDFRGGRRHNDKARRMTRRYEQILDAVQSGQISRRGVDPLIRRKIIDNVRAEFPNESPATVQRTINQRIEAYKSDPELTPEDEELINELALRRAAQEGRPSRDAQEYIEQITNDRMQAKALRFQLDGPGYKAAQDALREQFPYYITTDAHVRGPKDTINPTKDRGYVEPGRIRPTEARGAGLYGTDVNPGIKREGLRASTASHVDYQGAGAVRRGGTPNGGPGPQAEAPTEGKPEVLPKDRAKEIIQRARYADAAEEIHRVFNNPRVIHPDDIKQFPLLQLPAEEFRARANDPQGAREVSALFNELNQPANREELQRTGQIEAIRALDNYARAAGGADAKEYEPSLGLHWSAQPMKFPGRAYQPGASLDERQAEVRKINERTKSVLTGRNLSSLNDDEMRREVEALAEVYRVVKDNPDLQGRDEAGAQARKDIAAGLPSLQGLDRNAVELMLERPQKLEKRIEDVHRMRALMSTFQGMDRAQFTARDVPVPEAQFIRPEPRTPEQAARTHEAAQSLVGDTLQMIKDNLRAGYYDHDPDLKEEVRQHVADGTSMLMAMDDPGFDTAEATTWVQDGFALQERARQRRNRPAH